MSKASDMVNKDRKEIVDKLIANMKKGYFLSKEEWDRFAVRPQNPVSNLYYKGGNRLRLSLAATREEYKDPRWMTFNQAKDKGWQVKKGSKSVLCEKWIFTKKVKEKDETGKKVEKIIKLERPYASYFRLFNGEQIEGIPEIEKVDSKDIETLKIADTFIKSSECKITEVAQERAFYRPSEDLIVLPPREAFKDEASFLKTLLHEMGHSTGHPDRLDRSMKGEFGSPEYAREELNAELSSVFIQGDLGIQLEGEHFNDHSNYLKSWIGALEKDYNELFRACSTAEKIAERLYENYQTELVQNIEHFKINPLDKLRVTYHHSESDLGIKDETTLKGERAYLFLEKVMRKDKEINIGRENSLEAIRYSKLKLSLRYGSYTKENFRIDLGDLEFGGHTRVSNGLEHRLKSWTKELEKEAAFFANNHNTTPEKIRDQVKEVNQEIDEVISHLRTKEKEYLKKTRGKSKTKGMER